MPEQQQRDRDGRTGKYGGDDGAMEHERSEIQPGEDTGMTASPGEQVPRTGQAQAERKQEEDLDSGEDNPG